MAGGLMEQPCSIAVQFSLVLQLGRKSFYFPQALAPVLYTAHHLIKVSKVTGLVKVILPLHVQLHPCLRNTVAGRLLACPVGLALRTDVSTFAVNGCERGHLITHKHLMFRFQSVAIEKRTPAHCLLLCYPLHRVKCFDFRNS